MKSYQSHKVVQAARVLGVSYYAQGQDVPISDDTVVACLILAGEPLTYRDVTHAWMKKQAGDAYDGPDAEHDLVGGYLVVYPGDGYVSWSPAAAFETGYTEVGLVEPPGARRADYEGGYGWALDMLHDGRAVRRRGWNGVGLSVHIQVPDEHSKMTKPYTYLEGASVYGGRVPWVPSQSDHLAHDWELEG